MHEVEYQFGQEQKIELLLIGKLEDFSLSSVMQHLQSGAGLSMVMWRTLIGPLKDTIG